MAKIYSSQVLLMQLLFTLCRNRAECDEIDDFMTFHHYGDDVTIKLVAMVSQVLGE